MRPSCRRPSTRRPSPSTAPPCPARRSRKPRWKRGGRLHHRRAGRRRQPRSTSQRYFPPETKAAADELVRNVVAAMGRRIDELTWMAPETKARAQAKLANFTHQDRLSRPVAATIRRSRSAATICSATRCARPSGSMTINVSKLGEPIRRWEWGMTPMTINAYANFGMHGDRLPGRDPAAALLRSQRRPGDQLWRHRRGDRP